MSFNYQAAVNINAEFTGRNGTSQAAAALDRIDNSTKSLSRDAEFMGKTFKLALGYFSARAIIDYGQNILDLGDNLNDLRQISGFSVQSLSDLRAAGEQGGVEFASLKTGIEKFTKTISEALQGMDKAKTGFQVLGISMAEVKNTNPSDLLLKIADRFSEIEDGPAKAAAAMRLFGKSGAELIPLLNGGADSIRGLGNTITDEFASKADAFNDEIQKLKRETKQFSISLITDLMPALQDSAEALVFFTKNTNAAHRDVSILGEALRLLVGSVVLIGEVIGAAFDLLSTGLTQIAGTVRLIVQEFVDLGYAGDAAFKLITGDVEGAKQAFSAFKAEAVKDFKGYLDATNSLGDEQLKKLKSRFEEYAQVVARANKSGQLAGPEQLVGNDGKPTQKAKRKINNLDLSESYQNELDAIKKFRAEQEKEIELQKAEIDRVNMTEQAYKKLQIQKKLSGETEKAITKFSEAGKQAYRDATEEIINQKQALVDLEFQQKKSFGVGATAAFREYLTNAADTAAQTKQVFSRLFSGLEDTFVDFVKTGKLNFSNLIASLEADLLRFGFRKAVLAGIGGAFGFADGGIMTSDGPVPLRKYAGGGIANSPQLAVFGEGSVPEAFVPVPSGRIPVEINDRGRGSGSGSVNVSVAVNISSGGADTSTKSASGIGKDLGDTIGIAVRNIIIAEKKPGGLLR